MDAQSAAERVCSASAWLATYGAIATLLAVVAGGAYYFSTDQIIGLQAPLWLGLLAFVSALVSLVVGFFASPKRTGDAERRPISEVRERMR